MPLQLVDPTISTSDHVVPCATRLQSLDGVVIGLLNNGKTHGQQILARIAENLGRKYKIAGTLPLRKSTVSMPLPEDEMDSFAEECGAVLAAVGD